MGPERETKCIAGIVHACASATSCEIESPTSHDEPVQGIWSLLKGGMSDGTGPDNVTFGSKRGGTLSNRSASLGTEEADELLEWECMDTGEVVPKARETSLDSDDPRRLGALRMLLDLEGVRFRTFDHKVDMMEVPLAARTRVPG